MNHRAHRATTENRETTERTEQFPLYSLWCVICGVLVGCLSWPAMGEAVQVKQVLDHGDPANRIDLVFLPYSYHDDEVEQFAREVKGDLEVFFADPLFQEYQRYVNAYWVTGIPPQPVSDEWRADDPTIQCLGGEKELRARCAMVLKLREVLADRGLVPDVVFVYQHARVDRFLMGGNGVVLMPGGGWPIMLHEFGHAFADLVDEVVTTQGPVPDKSLLEELERRPNVTAKTRREEIKWKHWIAPETPLPTPFKTREMIPGLYPGVLYLDLYRPTYASRMGFPEDLYSQIKSFHDLPFGPINDEALLKRIYTLVSPIDRAEPTAPRLVLKQSDTQTFHVVPLQPLTHALEVTWKLDETVVHRGEAFVFTAASVSPGRHTLTAQVRDHDPRVRYDPEGLLTETLTWDLAVDSPFLLARIPDQTVKEGQPLQVQVIRLQAGVPLDVEGLPRGAVFNPTTGLLTWTPDFDQARHDQPGRVSLKVLARDAQGAETQPFTITVENVNRIPIPHFEQLLRRTVTVGESLRLHLPVVDLDGDAFDYVFDTCRPDPSAPSHLRCWTTTRRGLPPGAQFDPTAQTLTWQPEATHVGLYEVSLGIREGRYYYPVPGGIDIEVLPPPTPPAGWLTPMRQGNMLLLSWSGEGVLQRANAITGPWEPVPNAKSPYTVSVTEAAMKFFRVAPQSSTTVEPTAPVRKNTVTTPERPPSLSTPTVNPPAMRPTLPLTQRTGDTTEITEKRTAPPHVRVTPPPAAPATGSSAQRAGPSRPAGGGGVLRSRRSLSRRSLSRR